VIEFKAVDRRMCVLGIKGKHRNYSFMCALASVEKNGEM
jgi:hypothetical protein